MPGRDRRAEAGAEAAVGAGVEPAAGPLRLDVLAGEGDEVAAVADDDRVVREARDQLAVDAGGVDRVGLGGEQLRVPLRGGPHLVAQLVGPRPPVGLVAALDRLLQAVEDRGEVARDGRGELGVAGDLAGGVGDVDDPAPAVGVRPWPPKTP